MNALLRRYWLALLLLAAAWIAPALVYGRLPDPMPTHWNAAGVVDRWSPKAWGAFMLPGIATFAVLAAIAAPWLSPRGYEMNRFGRVYPTIVAGVAALNFWVTLLTLRAALGADVDVRQHVLVAIGLLVMLIGNGLGKITRNFFFGIRTPWTLANADVWERTHRFSGPVFVLGGLALVACGAMDVAHVAAPVAVVIAIVVLPFAHSFLTWRRLEGRAPR
jgi:uncharacterized membrane protein